MITEDDPLWYKDAIIYELHIKAFRDGSGDGTGDFIETYKQGILLSCRRFIHKSL